MAQTVQLLRTLSNNAPPALLPGAMSLELGGHTKLWAGSHTGNRLLLSDNPAELPVAGANYLPLTGGLLSGGLGLPSVGISYGGGNWVSFGWTGSELTASVDNSGTPGVLATNAHVAAFYLPRSGGTLSGGLSFGARTAGSQTDCSQHIWLYDAWGGFNITGGSLNIVAGGGLMANATGDAWIFHVPVHLSQNPTQDYQASTKIYVDTLVGAVESVTKLAGAYNAATDMVRPVQGVSQAGPLPPPDATTQGWYLIIEEQGLGIGNAPPVELWVGDWIISTGTDWVHLNLNLETVEAHNVAIAPIPDLLSTNVQDALAELPSKAFVDSIYLRTSGGTLSGELYAPAHFIKAATFFTWALTPSYDDELVCKAYVDAHDPAIGNYLPITGGRLSGDLELPLLAADNGVAPSSFNNYEWLLSTDPGTGDKYQTFRGGGWFDVWRGNSGQREWWSNNAPAMILEPSGFLDLVGGVSCTAVIARQGLFQIAPGYYLQRNPPDGIWYWVEGGVPTMWLLPSGDLWTRGNLVTNALFCWDMFLGPQGSEMSFFVSSDGSRYMQFNPDWGWAWSPSVGGNLYWVNPIDGRRGLIIGGDGICFNSNGLWYGQMAVAEDSSVADYARGLAEILRLRPRRYQTRVDVQREIDGGEPAPTQIGLLPDECEAVLPEAIVLRPRLADDDDDADLRSYDSRPVAFAVINALQEIDARLRAGGL